MLQGIAQKNKILKNLFIFEVLVIRDFTLKWLEQFIRKRNLT